jgi:hypothetical protein
MAPGLRTATKQATIVRQLLVGKVAHPREICILFLACFQGARSKILDVPPSPVGRLSQAVEERNCRLTAVTPVRFRRLNLAPCNPRIEVAGPL